MADSDFSITVVGLGLIGGSFAMALRKLNPKNLWGADIDKATVEAAEKMGIIDTGYTNAEVPLKESDIIIISLYPGQTISFIKQNISYFKPGAIITDTAGTKEQVVEEVCSFLPDNLDFIGGHPMAGRESQGLSHASCEVFVDANYILTPVDKSNGENIKIIEGIIKGIGCKNIIKTSPRRHDEIIALTSHLPHILAVSMINRSVLDDEFSSFIAGSFKDATRVADINSLLWAELISSNRDNVISEIQAFEENIRAIKDAIINGNNFLLRSEFEKAGLKRREIV